MVVGSSGYFCVTGSLCFVLYEEGFSSNGHSSGSRLLWMGRVL
jgi:hypothetical protein